MAANRIVPGSVPLASSVPSIVSDPPSTAIDSACAATLPVTVRSPWPVCSNARLPPNPPASSTALSAAKAPSDAPVTATDPDWPATGAVPSRAPAPSVTSPTGASRTIKPAAAPAEETSMRAPVARSIDPARLVSNALPPGAARVAEKIVTRGAERSIEAWLPSTMSPGMVAVKRPPGSATAVSSSSLAAVMSISPPSPPCGGAAAPAPSSITPPAAVMPSTAPGAVVSNGVAMVKSPPVALVPFVVSGRSTVRVERLLPLTDTAPSSVTAEKPEIVSASATWFWLCVFAA